MKAHKELWMILSALAVLLACFAPASFAGDRLTVRVNEPFEVNGQLFDGGELRVHEVGTYNPIATLNEVVVNGRSLGLVLARESAEVSATDQDELIFSRSASGHLVLVSVALQGQPVRELFQFREDDNGSRWQSLSDESFVIASRR